MISSYVTSLEQFWCQLDSQISFCKSRNYLFSFRNENLIELDRALIKNIPKALELELSILFSGVLRLFFQKTQIGNTYIHFFHQQAFKKRFCRFWIGKNIFLKTRILKTCRIFFKIFIMPLHFLKIFNRKSCQIVSGNLPS
jgi:hypothetical protein